MNTITRLCKAKINLVIDVLERLPNSYHTVRMVMMRVNFGDEVTVTLRDDNQIVLGGDDPDMPIGRENIAYRAAEAVLEKAGSSLGCDIYIRKRVPMGAGMAGGSADAAGVINMLNELLGEPLTLEERLEIGLKLGADVPFCIMDCCAIAEGIGEKLTPIPDPPEMSFVIAKPKQSISTKWAYENLDFSQKPREMDIDALAEAIKQGDAAKMFASMGNVFENVSIPACPEIAEYKDLLRSLGADYALMSGSGSAVFGIFLNRDGAESACREFEQAKPDNGGLWLV